MQKKCYPLHDFISISKYVKVNFNNKWRFYEKAQKNLRRFEKFYSKPRNESPIKDSSVFSYSEVMYFSWQITSSKDWQNGFYSEESTIRLKWKV